MQFIWRGLLDDPAKRDQSVSRGQRPRKRATPGNADPEGVAQMALLPDVTNLYDPFRVEP